VCDGGCVRQKNVGEERGEKRTKGVGGGGGGGVPDPEGWVSLFQGRPRTGLSGKDSYSLQSASDSLE